MPGSAEGKGSQGLKTKLEELISLKLFILHNSKKHSSAGMAPLVRARTRGPRGQRVLPPAPG